MHFFNKTLLKFDMRSRRVRKQDFETTEYNYNSWVLRNQGHLEKTIGVLTEQ